MKRREELNKKRELEEANKKEEAERKIAQNNGVNLNLTYSSKWFSEDDPLMPKNKDYRIWSNQYGCINVV